MNRVTQPMLAVLVAIVMIPAQAAVIPVAPTAGQQLSELLKAIDLMHVKPLPQNAAASERVCDNFLRVADYQRSLWLQSDVAAMDEACQGLLQDFGDSDVDAAWQMYQSAVDLQHTKFDYQIDLLENGEIDLGDDESLLLDRRQAKRPATTLERKNLWRKEVEDALISRMVGDDVELSEAREVLLKRYRSRSSYLEQVTAEDYLDRLAQALLTSYDPHSGYMTPQAYEDFLINTRLQLEGIGTRLRTEGDYAEIVEVIPGGPADRSGLIAPGDRILSVAEGEDGEFEDVVGRRLDRIVELIRGAKGTVVRIEVKPADSSQPHQVRIERELIQLDDQRAFSQVIEVPSGDPERTARVGVIFVPSFYAGQGASGRLVSVSGDIEHLIDELQDQAVDGIVLDLRGNGGGLLGEAIRTLDLFLPRGPRVLTVDRQRRVMATSRRVRIPYTGPLVVAVDRSSASASEIVAAAIQDYERGLIVGERSFGKGSVQIVTEVAGGQLRATIQKYYRVTGQPTQGVGVEPDVKLPHQYDHDSVGESSYPYSLTPDAVPGQQPPHLSWKLPPNEALTRLVKARTTTEPNTKYLKRNSEIRLRHANRDMVSLDLEARKREIADAEMEDLVSYNEHALAVGLPTFESYQELSTWRRAESQIPYAERDLSKDPAVWEAARVMADLVMWQSGRLTARHAPASPVKPDPEPLR